MIAVLAVLLALANIDSATQQVTVDVAEINHVYASHNTDDYRFTQVILWRFNPEQNAFRVA